MSSVFLTRKHMSLFCILRIFRGRFCRVFLDFAITSLRRSPTKKKYRENAVLPYQPYTDEPTFLFLRYFRHSPAPACRGCKSPSGGRNCPAAQPRPGAAAQPGKMPRPAAQDDSRRRGSKFFGKSSRKRLTIKKPLDIMSTSRNRLTRNRLTGGQAENIGLQC